MRFICCIGLWEYTRILTFRELKFKAGSGLPVFLYIVRLLQRQQKTNVLERFIVQHEKK
nr:MAG TPA: hypothetical protein [Caudoviricetes sp.]